MCSRYPTDNGEKQCPSADLPLGDACGPGVRRKDGVWTSVGGGREPYFWAGAHAGLFSVIADAKPMGGGAKPPEEVRILPKLETEGKKNENRWGETALLKK